MKRVCAAWGGLLNFSFNLKEHRVAVSVLSWPWRDHFHRVSLWVTDQGVSLVYWRVADEESSAALFNVFNVSNIGRTVEPSPTAAAAARRVESHVRLQISFLAKTFITNRAAEWFLSGVNPRVPFQIYFLTKTFPTWHSQTVSLRCGPWRAQPAPPPQTEPRCGFSPVLNLMRVSRFSLSPNILLRTHKKITLH